MPAALAEAQKVETALVHSGAVKTTKEAQCHPLEEKR